ncbi:MAG: tetratricopeptide repeat protein [Flavobacteriaceae bacterium]|nr:tetratricopeptide repeat protein [Flavobacteriaceae bacterium]
MAAYYQGEYLEVFDFWTRSLQAFEEAKDQSGVANMMRNLGVLYYDQGSQDKALEYYFKSLKISEKINDPVQITSNLVNIGVYAQMKEYDKALSYYKKIEPYFFNLKDPQISSSYLMGVGVGEAHSLRNDHVNAKKYFEEALLINKNTQSYAHNSPCSGKKNLLWAIQPKP